jgi:transcription initiation factor TFIID TATA-box-binding protein
MPESKTKKPKDKDSDESKTKKPKDKDSDDSEPKFSFKIENVVATVTLKITEKIDLNIIARKYIDVEYNPERFPGLIMRIIEPKATILIFSTGKMVVTGLRQAIDAPVVVDEAIDRILKCKITISDPEIIIQNIVASGDLRCIIDLNMAAVVMEYSMYEPEVFPGLIYRMQTPKSVFLIFSTGRIVCTGAKTREIVAEAVEKLYYEVRELGISRDPDDEPEFFDEEMTFL